MVLSRRDMMANSKNSMIEGNPARSLIIFSLPLIGGNILQQLYAIVDTMIVGKFVGQNALSAVGSMATISKVFVAKATGLAGGCTIVFSQLYGAKYYTRMKTAVYTAILSFLALSLIFWLVTAVFCDGLINLVRLEDALKEDARTYLLTYSIAFPASYMYNLSNSGFNSLGKSFIPLVLLAGSSVLNVGLDLLFVINFDMGVFGAAIATVISQYLAAAIALPLLLRYLGKNFKTGEKPKAFEWALLGNMAKIAVPNMLTMTIMSVGYLTLQSLVNTFGTDVSAGYIAGHKIDSVCIVPMSQIGTAVATYTGQNVGANMYDRISKGLRAAILMCVAICAVFIVLMLFFAEPLIGLFMEDGVSDTAINAGVQYITITCIFYVLMGIMSSYSGVLRGSGDIMKALLTTFVNFGFRVLFAYAGAYITGSEQAVWWSNPAAWFVALVLSMIFYYQGGWKKKRVADKV